MKKVISVLLTVFVLASMVLTGCGSSSGQESSKETTYKMRIPHVAAETHPTHIALVKFKEQVEKETNGAVTVEILPNGSLGGEVQFIEMVSMNSIEGAVVTETGLAGTVKEFALIGAPYIFKDRDAAHAALDGAFGEKLSSLAELQNIYIGGWGDTGMRCVSNKSHPIITPDDMKGIKIRVMENDLHMGLFRLYGANPTPIAFNELFTALQQGTVDAQENPITPFTVSNFFEVQKYFTNTEHVYSTAAFMISKSWLESLPQEYQTIVKDAAKAWGIEQREVMLNSEEESFEICKAHGMEIYTLTADEKQVWIDKANQLYETSINKMYDTELIELAKSFN